MWTDADDGRAEHQELGVVVRGVARQQQIALGRVAEREVDVLARTVDALERLLVEQTLHAVLVGQPFERRHQQLLVVGGDVGPLEHRRDLELAGGDFLMPGLRRNAELEQLPLAIHHEAEDALRDGTEVVVVEFLALRRLGAEQRATGAHQVGAGQEEVPVDQEVLLLRAGERDDVVDLLVPEQLQHPLGVPGHGLLAAQQGSLVVEGVTEHRDEDRRDAERLAVRVVQDVGRAGRVPTGVAAGLERVPQPAAGEAGAVRLALCQGLPGELGQRQTAAGRLEEAVVLFGGQPGERVEDVRVVRTPFLHRPVLHGRRDGVADHRIDDRGVFDGGDQRFVDRLGQPLLHHRHAEDVLAPDLSGRFVDIEGGSRRYIGLDILDRLQTDIVCAHYLLLTSALRWRSWRGPDLENLGRCRIRSVSSP